METVVAVHVVEGHACARSLARRSSLQTRAQTRKLRALAVVARQRSVVLREQVSRTLFRTRTSAAERRGVRAIVGGAGDGDVDGRRGGRPVVLIVDDHADTREMYTQFLQIVGFDTRAATTCADALTQIRSGEIDAVVLDRRLPDGDGVDMCRLVKTDVRTRDLPVVVVSGRQQDGASDADVYLMKPVVPDLLCSELGRLLAARPPTTPA